MCSKGGACVQCITARADIVTGLGLPPSKKFEPEVQVASASSTSGDLPSPHVAFGSDAVADEERRAALALDMLSSSFSPSSSSSHYKPFAPNPSANPRAYAPFSPSSSSAAGGGGGFWRAPVAHCKYDAMDDDDDDEDDIYDASVSSSFRTAMRAARDPRVMQEAAGRALVSHELRVELSDDLAFELRVTSVSRCSSVVCKSMASGLVLFVVLCCLVLLMGYVLLCALAYGFWRGVQAKCVHAEVPCLPLDEYSALLKSLRCGLLHATRPVSVDEQESVLPKRAPNAGAGVSVFESFAWVELSARRLISSLKLLGEFSALPLATQMQILKACLCCAVLVLLLLLPASGRRWAWRGVALHICRASTPTRSLCCTSLVFVCWRLLLGDRQRSPAARGAAESRPEGDGLPAQARGCQAHAPRRARAAASGGPGWTSLAHHQPPPGDRLRRGARFSH